MNKLLQRRKLKRTRDARETLVKGLHSLGVLIYGPLPSDVTSVFS